MAEQLDLATPIIPPSRTTYAVIRLMLDYENAVIQIALRGSDGAEVQVEYLGTPATALMTTLNKINLSTKSLQRRILEQLVTDGKMAAGTVSGTPA